MYYYGNPHLDPVLSDDDLIQDAAKAALAAGSVVEGPWGKTPPPTAIQDTHTNIPPSIPTWVMQNLPKVLSRLGGIGAMLYPSELGHGMIQKGHIGSIVEGPDWPGLTQEMWDNFRLTRKQKETIILNISRRLDGTYCGYRPVVSGCWWGNEILGQELADWEHQRMEISRFTEFLTS